MQLNARNFAPILRSTIKNRFGFGWFGSFTSGELAVVVDIYERRLVRWLTGDERPLPCSRSTIYRLVACSTTADAAIRLDSIPRNGSDGRAAAAAAK